MSKYVGARYIGKDVLYFGDGRGGCEHGTVCTFISEEEAKGRNDFEPMYAESKKPDQFGTKKEE